MRPINKYTPVVGLFAFLVLTFLSCEHNDGNDWITPGPNAQKEAQEKLIMAEEGNEIKFGAGIFNMTQTLTMDAKSQVTIRGRGRDKTILSFKGQTSGGDGLLITNSDNIIVRDLTIIDTSGDALKFDESDSIVMFNVGAEWSGEPATENGGYGIYPVNSSNILIEECYSYGASDSGIYVGQSDKAIVRNSLAEGNVAGIEIENTTNADVYGNTATDNAAGILVFDLPGLSQSGHTTRIFDNTIRNNIRGNFAPIGSIVAEVPAGTGILVLSTAEVEVFDNTLEGNNVVGTAVASYAALVEIGLVPPIQDPNYDPFPGNIFIHDNSFSKTDEYPDASEQSDFGNLLVQSFGDNPIPDIILDGIFVPESDESGTICLQDNADAGFVNLNLANNFPNNLSFEPSPHACSMASLPAVEVDVPEF